MSEGPAEFKMGCEVKMDFEVKEPVRKAKQGDTVLIHYTGYLRDDSKPGQKGKMFDSSRKGDKPFKTKIGTGAVIKGWDEGVPQIAEGSEATLYIRSDYAYGKNGFYDLIPSNSDLIFDVKLEKIVTEEGKE